MSKRTWVPLAVAVSLAACGVPGGGVSPHAPSPLTMPAIAPAIPGVPPDGEIYPNGNHYRVLGLQELPIARVSVDSTASGSSASALDDGDLSTQWVNGGYHNATAWAAVQLGQSATLGSIAIKTGPSPAGTSYDVQVSPDGTTYTTVLANQTNSSWNLETKALPAGTSGQWVRIFWHNSTSNPQAHFGIFELQVNGTAGAPSPSPSTTPSAAPSASPTSAPTPSVAPSGAPSATPSPSAAPSASPSDTPIGPDAIQTPISVTASSTYGSFSPQRAVDGDDSTQWASGTYQSREEWLAMQFHGRYHFDQVYVKTGSLPAGVSYQFEVSDDGVNWTSASSAFTGGSWYDQNDYVSGDGKYLRIHFFNNPSAPMARFQVFTIEAVGTPLSDGGNFPIVTAPGWQSGLRMAFNPNTGEYLTVWTDGRKQQPDTDVWGQFVRADGTLVGTPFDLTPDPNVQNRPDVVYNGTTNEFLVVWSDTRQSAGDIFAQRLTGDGQLIGGNFPITQNGASRQLPRLAYDSATNEYLLVWIDFRAAYNDSNVYGQRVNAVGTPVGGEIPICVQPGIQTFPRVSCASGSNSYMVAWDDQRDATKNGSDEYGQAIDASGNLLGGNFAIDTGTEAKEIGDLAYDWKANEFTMVWTDSNGNGSANIMAGRIATGGGLLGSPVTVSANGYPQGEPVIVYNGKNDEYLVAWWEAPNDWYGIEGCHLQPNLAGGAVYSLSPQIDKAKQGTAIGFDYADDTYFVGWSDFRSDPGNLSDCDLYGQLSW